MTQLWTPRHGQHQREALIVHAVEFTERLRRWNHELKQFDPDVQVCLAPERLSLDAQRLGLRPGYYHVIRTPTVGEPTVLFCHEDPETGERLDLDSSLFERLRRGDLWNDRTVKERKRLERKARRAAESERRREDEERVDEIMDRLWSRENASVRIPRAIS